ncbi:putative protein, chloroplastic [Cucurbita argyrosperma subsp. argyrosperma]|nr:putative protein, chloroplastic [Cucurbita argyrosperma subsp. argyrosperma]
MAFPFLSNAITSSFSQLNSQRLHFCPLCKSFLPVSFSSKKFASSILNYTKMEGNQITEEVAEKQNDARTKIFVAGASGSTGKRIVEQLLARGFAVKAGVRDVSKAKATLSPDNPALQIVKADVTEGSAKLAEAIGSDSEAVICATGFRPGWDLFAPWKIDNFGTVNLVEACRELGINRFVLISSILVNGAAMGQILNPAYIFLNVFGLTLIAKLQAERHIRKSGIDYTIIRPGGSISRDLVAEVAVEALVRPEASYKVVEIVSRADAPKLSYEDLFGSIKQR